MRTSKICSVPPNSTRSTQLNTKTTSSLLDVGKSKSHEAENAASKFLNRLLNDVDTITTGVVYEKSSCSVIPMYSQSKDEEELSEDHRLINWKKWLDIRERDSRKIARATLRHRQELLLNLNPNDCRKIYKRKEIIEKAIFDAGDLNFWKMPVKSRQGLFVTAPKTQVCERPEIIYTQTPDALLTEQKIKKEEAKSTLKILKIIEERKNEKLIKTESFEKFQPRMEKLALTGWELQLPCDISIQSEEIPTPTHPATPHEIFPHQVLLINGILLDNQFNINILIDLTFDSFKFDRTSKSLMLENRGDVAIDLSFESLEVSSAATFFFDKLPFRIIPGEVLEIPFHFYPIQAGLFNERWRLKCEPQFIHEKCIAINLIGVCKRKHLYDDAVAKLEAKITHKAAEFCAKREIKNLLNLSRPKCDELNRDTAIDPIEKAFKEKNPKLTYHPSIVQLMSQLHHQANGSEWNYDVDGLYRHIMNIHDNDEMQKDLYRQFNDAYGKLLNLKPHKISDDENIGKKSLIKSIFGQFFEEFHAEMEDPVNTIAENLKITINKMIGILET